MSHFPKVTQSGEEPEFKPTSRPHALNSTNHSSVALTPRFGAASRPLPRSPMKMRKRLSYLGLVRSGAPTRDGCTPGCASKRWHAAVAEDKKPGSEVRQSDSGPSPALRPCFGM